MQVLPLRQSAFYPVSWARAHCRSSSRRLRYGSGRMPPVGMARLSLRRATVGFTRMD